MLNKLVKIHEMFLLLRFTKLNDDLKTEKKQLYLYKIVYFEVTVFKYLQPTA